MSPTANTAGKIENVAKGAALDVRWKGGSEFEQLVLTIISSYCMVGPSTLLACHVPNSGVFTIPQEMMGKLDWSKVLGLEIAGSHLLPIAAPELDNAAWLVGSRAQTYIYYDQDAKPPAQSCENSGMAEGFVGAACSDDSTCGGGCCLRAVKAYFAGNYCAILGCTGDEQCPTDAACVRQTNVNLSIPDYCAKRCSSDADCRFPEYLCAKVREGVKACVLGVI